MKKTLIGSGLQVVLAMFLMVLVVPSVIVQKAASAGETGVQLMAYGPGGPAPAMRDAAKVFGAGQGIAVNITAGSAQVWKGQAMKNADLIFSGSENMMTNYVRRDLPGLIDTPTIRTLYLRPSAILVRPGNPKGIRGVKDLAGPGIKIIVVEGDGQVGMWEDVAGRTGDIRLVEGVRRNIGFYAAGSSDAKKLWNNDKSYDAWLVWTIWQKENPASADLINTEKENTIYRSCSIAITNRSKHKATAKEFIDFLQSDQGREIFKKWGWVADK